MKLHEYQAKELFRRHGIPVPRGQVAEDAASAKAAAAALGGGGWVVKAQVHAGGRGKAGGVKLVRDAADEVGAVAGRMLGSKLVTHQTGPQGVVVRKVLIEETADIAREFYAAITLDRAAGVAVLMVSAEGGVEIEKVAAETPEKIHRFRLETDGALPGFRARQAAFALGLAGKTALAAAELFTRLARVYQAADASLAEVNPLITTKDGRVVALDAKVGIDDSALFRQKELASWRDRGEEAPAEVRATEAGLSYIALDGNIGCLVNGAGLAMSTMDIIKLHGGEPANFLDVGGGATAGQVTEAFKIILEDPKVEAILVNIFGGIMKCDVIAQGILEAVKAAHLQVPLVVRLEGTNVEEGRKLLAQSAVRIINAKDMTDAAKKVVAAAGAAKGGSR